MRQYRNLFIASLVFAVGLVSGCGEQPAPPRQEIGSQPAAPEPMVSILDSGTSEVVLFGKEEDFDAALRARDTDGNIAVNNIGSMFPVKNGSRVEVIDRDDAVGKAKVRLLEGDSANEIGWVNTSWLKQVPASSVSQNTHTANSNDEHKTPEEMCDEYCAKLKEAGYFSVGPGGDDLLLTGVWVGDGGKVNVGVRQWFFDASRPQQQHWLQDLQRVWASIYRPSKDAFVEVDDDFGKGKIKVTHKRIIGLPAEEHRIQDLPGE